MWLSNILVRGNVDILLLSETKLDGGFPMGQSKTEGFNGPFRFDHDISGDGI